MKRRISTKSVGYGISLQETKDYIRIEHTLEDALLNGLITASYKHICNETNRDFVETAYTASVSGSESILASYLPVQDVSTGSVFENPSLVIVENYIGDISWKTEKGTTVVPDEIKTAQLMLCAHWYENRGAHSIGSTTPLAFAVGSLIAPYIIQFP